MTGDTTGVEVKVGKPPKPTIWLDTALIIDLTNMRLGQDVQSTNKARLERFLPVLQRRIREGSIYCPEGDQAEEYKLGDRYIRACHETQTILSQGIRFKHRLIIERFQTFIVAKAYLSSGTKVELSYSQAFFKDPERTLSKNQRFIISVFSTPDPSETPQKHLKRRQTTDMLENLRQELRRQGVTFEEQLEDEYSGRLQAAREGLRRFEEALVQRKPITFELMSQALLFQEMLSLWRRAGGKPENLVPFIQSAYYRFIPSVDISSMLYAAVVTGQAHVLTGDSMDIGQISACLPYVHYMVTDNKMSQRIRQLGLDAKYQTRIFSYQDLDDLTDLLDTS